MNQTILSLIPVPSSAEDLPHELISKPNDNGNTHLHWAAYNGHLEIVKLLVTKFNADASIANDQGHDAAYVAKANSQYAVANWLLAHCDELEFLVANVENRVEEN